MVKFILGFIFLVCLTNCRSKEPESQPAIKISKEALVNAKPFTDFLYNVSYVPLETVDSSLLSDPYFQVTPECIWAIAGGMVFAFDRQQGKFLRTIGRQGRGPGEYSYTFTNFNNLPTGKIYNIDYDAVLLQYDVSGKFDRKISPPVYESSIENPSVPTVFTCLNDTLFCAYYSNMNGLEKKRLVLFSPDGHEYRVFPNHNIVEGVKSFHTFSRDGIFYSRNKDIYFKESTSDTVFMVTADSLKPHLLVDMGEFSIPYAGRYWSTDNVFFMQKGLYESDRYFYFWFYMNLTATDSYLNGDYLAVYDKESETQEVYEMRKSSATVNLSEDDAKHAQKITLDGFCPGYFVSHLSAMYVRGFFGDTVHTEQWKNVKEDDNPVLVFWKLP